MATMWAGEFACSVCRRKRLPAAEFSKNQAARFRADPAAAIKCKKCVEAAAAAESTAAAKSAQSSVAGSLSADLHECAACQKSLPTAAFNKNQLRNKGPGKQRCQECVAAAGKAETSAADAASSAKLERLREDATRAEASGSSAQKLVTAAAACAAEAELVTGLKPIKLGRGRGGRGGWRGRSRGSSGGRR
eukprot:m.200400 g.200400  ORF g.200400 m.200400 type:complete len:191 (+) comp15335_c1_seq2:175-747(+)